MSDRAGARRYRATRWENASKCASPDRVGARPYQLNVRRRIAPECVPTSRTGSDDPIFQPAKFSAENPLRDLFTAQIHIVSNAAKQTIDA
jgi:hypothetical protein